jgi:hypothetical protein
MLAGDAVIALGAVVYAVRATERRWGVAVVVVASLGKAANAGTAASPHHGRVAGCGARISAWVAVTCGLVRRAPPGHGDDPAMSARMVYLLLRILGGLITNTPDPTPGRYVTPPPANRAAGG